MIKRHEVQVHKDNNLPELGGPLTACPTLSMLTPQTHIKKNKKEDRLSRNRLMGLWYFRSRGTHGMTSSKIHSTGNSRRRPSTFICDFALISNFLFISCRDISNPIGGYCFHIDMKNILDLGDRNKSKWIVYTYTGEKKLTTWNQKNALFQYLIVKKSAVQSGLGAPLVWIQASSRIGLNC
ncbi:hypothetical protein TNCV_1729031 [Trichonephila clavipes]|nr:hypothetical protein TNCV_1729031 [Trichonephila clavipes]